MTVPNSFSGKAIATTLTADVSNVATSFTVVSASTWTETVGSHVGQPLGTSGNFVVTLDYGQSTEEKVLCSAIAGSGPYTITVAQRGYDGTSAVGHYYASGYPVVHTYSADVPQQANLGVTNAATAQTTANSAQSDATTALANAATAQTTANTAQTTALGTQVTGASAFSGSLPGSATQLRTFGWTQNVTAASAGTTITLPNSLFSTTLLSVVATNANESAGPGAYCTVKAISGSKTTFTVFIYTAGGTKATSGTYQINFMVSGY